MSNESNPRVAIVDTSEELLGLVMSFYHSFVGVCHEPPKETSDVLLGAFLNKEQIISRIKSIQSNAHAIRS